MTATAVKAIQPIPGLHSPLTVDDMNKSKTTYNGLPRIPSDMHVSQDHIKNLLAMIEQDHHLTNSQEHLSPTMPAKDET
ncbi:hypothetical protein B0J14DRAFT_651120 [Halenospora varia]|nr:hypothetical protein B0J14DRAFT_651120 [Halenospora varia]